MLSDENVGGVSSPVRLNVDLIFNVQFENPGGRGPTPRGGWWVGRGEL